MAEHRVPMLSPALHRQPDPEHSRDPRIRALVGQLRTLDGAPAPQPEFRAELRAQLVAITPRIVAEGDAPVRRRPSPVPAATAAVPVKTPGAFRTGLKRLGQVKVGRPLAVVTCVIAVFAVLLGGAVWISKRALPGDALYGLKRASENLQESLTSGDSSRAKLLLSFADNRYDEVSDLLPRGSAMAVRGSGIQAGGGQIDSHTASLVTNTLNSADTDVKQAMQALGSQAIRDGSGSGLKLVTDWAGGPTRQLAAIVARIPAGSLHQRTASSLALLSSANARAHKLVALGDCACLSHARTDPLGAVPCTKCVSAARAVPNHSSGTKPSTPGRARTSTATRTTGGGATGATGAAAGSSSAATGPGAGTASGTATHSAGGSTAPGLPGLPGLSNLVPSGSSGSCSGLDLGVVSIGSCGVRVGDK